MSEKFEFKRDVGQVVMGNVNEAPRLSNVVTLHVGDKEKEVELITPFQRKNIKLLVDKLATLVGDKGVKIYLGLITDYGLQKFKELPRSKYQEVKAILERRIEEATPQLAVSVADTHIATQPTHPIAHHPHVTLPCMACSDKEKSLARSQRNVRFLLVAMLVCLTACGGLFYWGKAHAIEYAATAPKDEKCYIAGKSYSIGYIERVRGSVPVECVASTEDMPAMWLPANRGR
ncbi:hypothetical protein ACL9RI_17375 [Janthinobacterium sp. Mn2066]|uniref:hypothetical protein n=1 Tax=Janthinobacterium sp. Mn2066 TaxID=3395264 RepID=UPI003BCF5AEB